MCGCRFYCLQRLRRNKHLRTFIVALVVACLIAPAFAQKHPPKQTSDSSQNHAAQQKPIETASAQAGEEKEDGEDKNPWKGLQYRLVGPFRGGRMVAVSGVVG